MGSVLNFRPLVSDNHPQKMNRINCASQMQSVQVELKLGVYIAVKVYAPLTCIPKDWVAAANRRLASLDANCAAQSQSVQLELKLGV